jgi:hypothetical protein
MLRRRGLSCDDGFVTVFDQYRAFSGQVGTGFPQENAVNERSHCNEPRLTGPLAMARHGSPESPLR